jgi:hypothetical protein
MNEVFYSFWVLKEFGRPTTPSLFSRLVDGVREDDAAPAKCQISADCGIKNQGSRKGAHAPQNNQRQNRHLSPNTVVVCLALPQYYTARCKYGCAATSELKLIDVFVDR